MLRAAALSACCSGSLVAAALAQVPERAELAVPGAAPLVHEVHRPDPFDRAEPAPLLVLIGAAPEGTAAAAARAGFVVVTAPAREPAALAALLADLRQRFFVDQIGVHLGGDAAALQLAVEHGHEAQSLTLWDCGASDGSAFARLRDRRVRLAAGAQHLLEPLRTAGVDVRAIDAAGATALAAHFAALHGERALAGAAGEVARALDDFHDAAAKGDERRYFARLPDDAVFLGTAASERWTGAEFRAFALPYFERGPAWTYVPLRREITVAEGGAVAWFDERLDNEHYGTCRGTGVLQRRDGGWVVQQYSLSIPVPNELARDLVARIRAHAAGR